jgi:transglutaminase-like putative cysteine protease
LEGELLKGDMMLGMALYKEPKSVAQNMLSAAPAFFVNSVQTPVSVIYQPPADFAIATAITPDTSIQNPRSVRSLSLIITGVENEKFLLSDDRQKVTPVEGEEGSYRVEVTAKPFDPEQAAHLPVSQPSLRRYLQRAPYLEIGDALLQKTARALRAQETNAYRVASRIRAWVHQNMTPDYTIGVPRSCVEVLKRRRGVCRDYATLFAGLARAAGIPTRMVGGIVYGEGRFFYHAWVECWVGAWVPFDATLNTDFVDATHIPFVQGDVTDIYRFTELVGRLKVTVVSAQ